MQKMNLKNMDKTTIVNTFMSQVDNLRSNAKCSQKEKIACFQQIAECIMSPAMESHINYATHCSTAANVLLLFCEDLDAACRMSAEENLYRIFRALEKTRVSRILMDLFGEIKRNGNQRSLRICLNLFAYYSPRIKEKHIEWYAIRLLHCMQTIAQRKETQLCECLCEFVKNFGKNLQHGLTDSETCRLFEAFIAHIGVECAVKRRCSAQNCISLIENSRNKSLMAKHGLNKVIELLLTSQEPHSILGALGFLRLLLSLVIRGFPNDMPDDDEANESATETEKRMATAAATNTSTTTTATNGAGSSKDLPQSATSNLNQNLNNEITTTANITNECRQIIEIYDYCLHLLSTSNTQQQHAIINASLEVINAVLQALDLSGSCTGANTTRTTRMTQTAKSLKQLLSNQQLQHNEYLRKRKSLKNQIFQQFKIYDDAQQQCGKAHTPKPTKSSKVTPARKVKVYDGALQSTLFDEVELPQNVRHQNARSISECVDDDFMAIAEAAAARTSAQLQMRATTTSGTATLHIVDTDDIVDDIDDDDFTTLSEINEPQQTNLIEQKKRKQQRDVGKGGADADDGDDDGNDDDVEATTMRIDVENLIDAIDATSNVGKNENEQTRNLLTSTTATNAGDDKSSQHLSDFDNESFNSIDFEAEITIGGACGDGIADAGGAATADNISDTTKTSSDAIGSFFNNLISHSSAASESVSKLFRQSSASSSATSKVMMTPTKMQTQTTAAVGAGAGAVAGASAATDKCDAVSLTSVSATDSLSLISATSENKRSDAMAVATADTTATIHEDEIANYTQRRNSSNSGESPADMLYDESYSRTGSVTASTAVLVDNNFTRQTTAADLCSSSNDGAEYDDDDEDGKVKEEEEEPHKIEVEFRRKANVNPFLVDNSPLKQTITAVPQITLKIGTIFEQPLLYYTARCVSARFLLTGEQQSCLQSDANIRVSIKSLALVTIAQCVRLMPQVLQLQLEITAAELRLLELQLEMPAESQGYNSNSSSASQSPDHARSEHSDSSHLGMDYEHVDNKVSISAGAVGSGMGKGDDLIDFSKPSNTPFARLSSTSLLDEDNSLLLDIKDDHFGKSTCDHLLNQPLSRSADPVMLAQQMRAPLTPIKQSITSTPPPRIPPKKTQADTSMLSKSDIVIASSSRRCSSSNKNNYNKLSIFKVTESAADMPPPMLPPKPPKRTKSIKQSSFDKSTLLQQYPPLSFTLKPTVKQPQQRLSDILLYFNHTDPMLRSGVQQIVGSFLQATKAGLTLQLTLNLQHLLAILIKGLEDEIHTVIVQALNAFDKIFPHVLSKYLTEPPSCHYQRQQPEQSGQQKDAAKNAAKCHDNAHGRRQHEQDDDNDVDDDNDGKGSGIQSHCANDMFYVTQELRSGPTGTYTTRTQLFTDNDELIDALLNTFQLQSNCIDNGCNDVDGDAVVKAGTAAKSNPIEATSFSQPTTTTTLTSAADSKSGSSNATQTARNGVVAVDFFYISPKLLLDKLRLCHHNKYWLVQNKYAEVISNLNYAALRTYYEQCGNANYELSMKDFKHTSNETWLSEAATASAAAASDAEAVVTSSSNSNSTSSLLVDFFASDIVCSYETHFLDELLQLVGDADVRVRQHAADCLCRFVIQNAKQHVNVEAKLPTNATKDIGGVSQKSFAKETLQTNLNLVWDFFDYSIFCGLPQALRDMFRATATNAPPLMEVISNDAAIGDAMTYASAAIERNFAEEEKVLAKVLYRLTNKLMTLSDKNLQLGIVYALRLLLKHFNFVDFHRAWLEFNFMEICMKFSYYNITTAVDLNCQCDLIDVTGKLLAGAILVSAHTPAQQQLQQQQIEQLLTHCMKILNIYFHLFTNQKPLLFVKAQKGDLFANARELAIVQCVGYFGNDFVYIKLYNILKSANDSYKITINPESGTLLMSLLKICLNTLCLCLELRSHSAAIVANVNETTNKQTTTTNTTPKHGQQGHQRAALPPHPTPAVLKLIEEILQYLTKLINYAPGECIACLRQLLKYLFGQNYGNRPPENFDTLVRAYFGARVKGQQNDNDNDDLNKQNKQRNEENKHKTINSSAATATATGAMTMTLSSHGREESKHQQQQQQQQQATPFHHDLIATHGNYAASVAFPASSSSILSPSLLALSSSSPVTLPLSVMSSLSEQRLFAELFASGLSFHTWHYERESECIRHIKLFERLVIYCLTLFMKSNAIVQAPILALLSQLLDLNVTYSILDSKNVIFEQILNNLEIIETGNARNADIIIPPMIKFLVQLTHKSDRKLITIPKIISITNNLLANNTIGDYAVLALKALTYEIFFISQTRTMATKTMKATELANKNTIRPGSAPTKPTTTTTTTMSSAVAAMASVLSGTTPLPAPAPAPPPTPMDGTGLPPAQRAPYQSPIARSPLSTPQALSPRQHGHMAAAQAQAQAQETANAAAAAAEALLSQQRELDTQKEVVMGMLEKFIDGNVCQQVLCLLLLREQCSAELEMILELNADKILRARRMEGNSNSSSIMPHEGHGSGCGSGSGSGSADCTDGDSCNNNSTIHSMAAILPDSVAVYATVCHAMSDGHIRVRDWNDFFVLNTIFCNYGKSVLADSKEFLTLLQLFITKHITGDFNDLAYATIILENVILKTEEIYLVNHIKLYLNNQPLLMKALQRTQAATNFNYDVGLLPLQDGPSTSSGAVAKARAAARITGAGRNNISEIKYFARMLCEKLDDCLASITGTFNAQIKHNQRHYHHDHHHRQRGHHNDNKQYYVAASHYYQLAVRFVSALYDVCCRSRHKDALQSVFRMVLAETDLLDKYYNLLMMGGSAGDIAADVDDDDGDAIASSTLLLLQFKLFELLSAVKLLDPMVMLQQIQTVPSLKWNVPAYVRRRLLHAIISAGNDHVKPTEPWQRSSSRSFSYNSSNRQQVLELCSDIKSVNFLIADIVDARHSACIYDLCQVDKEFCSLLLSALLQQANMVNKRHLRGLVRLLLRISGWRKIPHHRNVDADVRCAQIEINARIIAIFAALHRFNRKNVLIKQQLLRAASALFNAVGPEQERSICESLQRLEFDDQQSYACFLFLNALRNLHGTTAADIDDTSVTQQLEQRIIDEKWLFAQLIKFSVQTDCEPQQLVKILLDIQSENKLHKIFANESFDVARVLPHAIAGSVAAMLTSFRNNCIQHNPHIHYMRPNPLARVTNAVLMAHIEMAAPAASHAWEFCTHSSSTTDEPAAKTAGTETGKEQAAKIAKKSNSAKLCYIAKAVIALMESCERIEATALVYIEAKFIEKFVREQILQAEQLKTLLRYLSWSCRRAQELLQQKTRTSADWSELRLLMLSIGKMLAQNLIWNELNQIERPTNATTATTTTTASGEATKIASGESVHILTQQQRGLLLCHLLELLALAVRQTLQHTSFYKRFKVPLTTSSATTTATTAFLMTSMMQKALSDAAASAASTTTTTASDADAENDDVDASAMAVDALLDAYAPKAILIAKLIETKIDVDATAGILSAAYASGGGSSCLRGGNIASSVSGLGGAASGCSSTATTSLDVDTLRAEFETACAQLPLHLLTSIGISILRTNQFYAYAVTPHEIVQHQGVNFEQNLQSPSLSGTASGNAATLTPSTTPERRRQKLANTSGKMPTIPVESLSDVDILRKFVKRLSIFGFTTRQQFEEYFMTFLLLINKVYDENMVDEQEQFHIKSNCLEAILELLITYKTFPIVGNKIATRFHHTTRWSRINFDSISLKKLHKVQLLIDEANVFYHPNLERQLATTLKHPKPDTISGTNDFQPNQYDLNFSWQQMEAYAQPTAISPTHSVASEFGDFSGLQHTATAAKKRDGGQLKKERTPQLNTEDNATKNFRYFSKQSGIDFKSSSQLIFDVLMQLIEFNHYLVLPNLVKFTEICESREQIKCIKEKAFKLQEHIPIDDTISHQHLIYLVCKTQSMLIPSYSELQQLCSLISSYLKSSHIFIRNATLQGLICLLECCSKTNTTIGKLSDELALLRDLILNYINRHGIIDKSPIECSDAHTKLVWTLNYCLIEWTTKFVPQCHLLSNTVIAASNFLRQTNNEEVFLCVLHGLERLVVIGNNNSNGYGTNNSSNKPNAAATTTTTSTAASATTSPAASNINIATADNAGVVGMVTPLLRHKIEKLALDLVKLENEKFSIPALKLLLSCMYMGSAKQLENTELSNGIVQDDPEIIAQQTDKVDILLHCIKSSTRDAAWIYGQVLCQIIRDLVPPNEILTKVIKEFLAINQPHCDVIAMIVYQVFRCAIDSSFLQMLQDWLICSLPTFLALPAQKGVWGLSVIFLSASINLHLIKLFPVVVAQHNAIVNCGIGNGGGGGGSDGDGGADGGGAGGGGGSSYGAARDQRKLGQHEIALFVTAAQDFHAKLSAEQKMRFRDAFKKFQQHQVYAKMLQSL